MIYLVDTHYLIWSLFEPAKIPRTKLEILLDPLSTKVISKISFWEIAIKYSLGKLRLGGITPEELIPIVKKAGYELLDLSEEDLASCHRLPPCQAHRDPFDRLLIWQCIRNRLVLLSSDERIKEYAKFGLEIA